MKVSFKIKDLAVAFDKATKQAKESGVKPPKYVCNFIRDELMNLNRDESFNECADELRVTIARYFKMTDTAHNFRTIPGWFAFYDFGETQDYYYLTLDGKRITAPHPFTNPTETRSFFLNYIVEQDPEAILSFETSF